MNLRTDPADNWVHFPLEEYLKEFDLPTALVFTAAVAIIPPNVWGFFSTPVWLIYCNSFMGHVTAFLP